MAIALRETIAAASQSQVCWRTPGTARGHSSCKSYRTYCESRPAEVVANIAVCLIHQTNYLLDRQIRRLELDFIKEGGLRERMTRSRLRYRNRMDTTDGTNATSESQQSQKSYKSQSKKRDIRPP